MANSLKVFIGVSILFSIFLVTVFGTESNTIYETKSIEIQYSDCGERDYSNTNFLDVSNIQEFLKNENFFGGKISGYLDDTLLASIKAFQKFTGIRVDGIIGPSTHKAMTSFDPCTRTVNTILIDCGGYLAYKECVWFFGNQNLATEISSTITTTTTIPAEDISNMVDCDDGGKMWHGDQGTLWNQAGESIIYNNCDEHRDAKNRGYDFTEKPIPGITPGVGYPSTTSSASSNYPTINNLGSVTIAENQTSVVTISATNPSGGSMTYSLAGTDSHLMTVNSSGVITLNSDANYEEKTSYSVTANVSNSNGTTSKAFTISVSDTSEDAIVDLLYVAAGGARDITESDMVSGVDNDISTNNTYFENSQIDITYNKRLFMDSTETFNVTNNGQMYDL